jgi:hypothetical protein
MKKGLQYLMNYITGAILYLIVTSDISKFIKTNLVIFTFIHL